MTSVNRTALCFVLIVLAALHLAANQARAEPPRGPALTLAMLVAPLNSDAIAPPLAAPAKLVCYPSTQYVLPYNCYKACLNRGHPPAVCRQRVPLCQRCWQQFVACTNRSGVPVQIRCRQCSQRYAVCMRPFW